MNTDAQDMQELADEILGLQELNQNLVIRLEQKENEIREMSEFIQELNAENNEKNNAIAKASKVIESLRDELEKAKDDIKLLELDKQKLSQENKLAEKELFEIHKENLNYENLKKSETRAKTKTQKLKDEIAKITQDFNQKEQELLQRIDELHEDNKRIEMRLHENDSEVLLIKEQYALKDKEFLNTFEKVIMLEEENQKLANEVQTLKKEKEILESNHARELRIVKKEAENSIRFYKNTSNKTFPLLYDTRNKENEFNLPESQLQFQDTSVNIHDVSVISENKSFNRTQNELDNQLDESALSQRQSFRKTLGKQIPTTKRKTESVKVVKKDLSKKTLRIERTASDNLQDLEQNDETERGKNILKNNVDFLKVALAESIERENNLVQYIEKHIGKEAEVANKLSETVFQKEIVLRPEVERWMMRNEELEQRLFDHTQKIKILEIMIKDCQKALEISQFQRSQEKKLSEQMIKELESLVNFLHIEVEEKNKVILGLLPDCENEFIENVAVSQSKTTSLYSQYKAVEEDLARVRSEQENLLFHFEDLKKKHGELLDHYFQLRKNISDLGILLKLDFDESYPTSENEVFDIQSKYEEIVRKTQELLNTEKEYEMFQQEAAEERQKLKGDISNLEKEIRNVVNDINLSQKEKMVIQDDLAKCEDALKETNHRLEDSRKRISIMEKEHANLVSELLEKDKEISTLKDLISDKNNIIQQMQLQIDSLKDELHHKSVKIENLMGQTDEVIKQKEQIYNDYVQTFELLESTMKDFETAQNNLETYENELKIKEEELDELRQRTDELEIRLEETEFTLKEKEHELTAANITIEHKNSTVNMLEEKFKETRENEENLKSELARMKIEFFSENLTYKNDTLKPASFRDRLPSKDLAYTRSFESGSKQMKYNSNTTEKENIEREPETAKSHSSEGDGDRTKSKDYYEKKIKEYEIFLDYIQTYLRNISEENLKLSVDHTTQEKIQEVICQNSFLANLYISVKQTLKTITFRLQDLLDSEIRFVSKLTQIVLERYSLSSQERKMLEDHYSYVLNLSNKNNLDSKHMVSTLKDQILNILKKENTQTKRDVSLNSSPYEPKHHYSQSLGINSNANISKFSDLLLALSSNFVEKAALFRPIMDKLNKLNNRNQRDGFDTLANDTIEELINYLQQISTSEARVLSEISQSLKESLQNPSNEDIDIGFKIDDVTKITKEIMTKCNQKLAKAENERDESMKSYMESQKHSSNPNFKSLEDSKRELKNHAFQLLKEFFAEISGLNFLDVVAIFYKFCNKSKGRYANTSNLIEDPSAIFKAFEENLNKNNHDFIETLKKEFAEYISSEEEISEENEEFLQKIFNFRVKLFNIDKLEDEARTFKNVFKLLDISWLFKEMNKKEENELMLNYDQLRNQSHEANKVMEKVIEMLPSVMLKSWNLVGFDKKSLNVMEDPQKLYDKLRSAYSDPYELIKKNSGHKSHIRYQMTELLRENGGCRIAMNYLLHVFYKFKIIIEDLTLEDS